MLLTGESNGESGFKDRGHPVVMMDEQLVSVSVDKVQHGTIGLSEAHSATHSAGPRFNSANRSLALDQ